MTTNIVDKDGNSIAAADATVPSDRLFRNAWTLSGSTITEDLTTAKTMFKDKIREVRKPLLEEQDVAYMKAIEADDDDATIKQSKEASFSDVVKTVRGLRGPNKGAKAGSKLPPVDRGRATYVPRNAISDPAKGTGEGRKGSKKPKGRTVIANKDKTGRTIDNFLRGMFSFAGSLDQASDTEVPSVPKSENRKRQDKQFSQFKVKTRS